MRRFLAPLGLVILAAALAGCGGRNVDPVTAAASKSERAGGAHVTTRVTVTFPSGGEGLITGEGSFDQRRGKMSLDMSNLLQNSPLPLGSGSGIKARYLNEGAGWLLYLHLPFFTSSLPKGKRWIRIDLQQAGAAALGANFSELLGQAGQNPVQALDMLRATGTPTKVGPDIVGGVRSTQYRTTIDLKKALRLNGVSRPGIRRLIASSGSTELPVDVWIGTDGLVRQLRTETRNAMSGTAVSTATLTTMSHWGTKVSVETPPAGQVYDATTSTPNGSSA
jgi:hypothetical protein